MPCQRKNVTCSNGKDVPWGCALLGAGSDLGRFPCEAHDAGYEHQ